MEITYFWVCAFWKKFFNLFLILQFKLLWEPKITLPRMIYGSSGKFWLTNNLLLKEEKMKKNTPQWKIQVIDFTFCCSFKVKLMCYKRKFNFPRCYTTLVFDVSLFLLLVFPSFSLFCLFFHPPFLFLSSPL